MSQDYVILNNQPRGLRFLLRNVSLILNVGACGLVPDRIYPLIQDHYRAPKTAAYLSQRTKIVLGKREASI